MSKALTEMTKTELKNEAKELIMEYVDHAFYAISDNSYGYSEDELELLEDAFRIQRERVINFLGYKSAS